VISGLRRSAGNVRGAAWAAGLGNHLAMEYLPPPQRSPLAEADAVRTELQNVTGLNTEAA
jgi:hypothetical protein